jgi:hypothetical protein
MTSVGNFPSLETEIQYEALKSYLESEKLHEYLLQQHISDRNGVTRMIKDASEYFLAEDFSAVLCDNKIVLCKNQWVQQISVLIAEAKSCGSSTPALI